MVDLLTVIPIWVFYFDSEIPSYLSINTFKRFLLYAMHALNTTRILRALRVRKKLLLIEDVVDRCLADMALIITIMILFSKFFVVSSPQVNMILRHFGVAFRCCSDAVFRERYPAVRLPHMDVLHLGHHRDCRLRRYRPKIRARPVRH
jgi:hypothetical protein